MTKSPNTSRGYSLLEMIVSVGIFSVIMVIATGAYLTLINLDRQARATNDVVSNLSFAVDSMSRAVRTGKDYKCNNVPNTTCVNVNSPGTSLGFTDSDGRTIVYSLVNSQIVALVTPPTGSAFSSKLTDPRITIQALHFFVRGVGTGDGIQPQVLFTIAGVLTTDHGKTVTFSIEGGATQRVLDL